ncbi:MAG: cutinase family protein, partial [Gordonia sp. (in: high G+C Gram-positive bacteria)]
MQGTGESSRKADPDQDSGFLSLVLGPLQDGQSSIDRKYIPYDAGFGGAVPGGKLPYSESIAGAVSTGVKWINALAARCPQTRVALVGYSQGAHAARMIANSVVTGKTRLSTDHLAAVAAFGDPTRPKGAALFPGAPGRTTPAAA